MSSRAAKAGPRTSARISAPESKRFEPATELGEWAMRTFVVEDAPLLNEEHRHLRGARIGWLWAPIPNFDLGRPIAGNAQLGKPGGDPWESAKKAQQLEGWFGSVPDFLIQIHAEYWRDAETSDAMRCALVEHEMLHCGIARKPNGQLRFRKSGAPVWGIRPHDIEEFNSVAQRYGAKACGAEEFVHAALFEEGLDTAAISKACGTCRR